MKKQLTAFFFLLVANGVLLAHAVIPHHHHQNIACVERSHCQNNHIGHKHTTPADNHHHDGNPSANCILTQAVFVPSNQGKNEVNGIFCLHENSFDFPFTLPYPGNNVFIPIIIDVTSVPDVSFSYHSCINPPVGLRAPPVV